MVYREGGGKCGKAGLLMKSPPDSPVVATRERATLIGTLWMVGSVASFVGMALSSRELIDTIPILQIQMLRSAVGLVVMALLVPQAVPEIIRLRNFKFHGIRNVIHFGAQYCWTVGIALLPLAYVFALEFTMPIWAAIFAWLVLGERISRIRAVAIAVSFVGVIIVVEPGSGGFGMAALVVLLAAVGFGVSAVMVKQLTARSSSAVIVMWMVALQLPFAAILVLATGEWVTPSWRDAPLILVLGLTALSAHYMMAQALRFMDASLALPIDFLRVPLIAIFGWLLYDEAISAAVFVGAALIFGANYMAMRAERGSSPRQ